jgi:Ser/Thr protein kinase RdoA (MazF antagonist)
VTRPAAPAATHDVRTDAGRGVVVKRFRSWARDEPAREWRALRLLAAYAPGLAPRPLSLSMNGPAPTIEMSWLPGQPLGPDPLIPAQSSALAGALGRLWRSVPPSRIRGPGSGATNAAALVGQVRRTLAAGCDLGDDARVREASARASAWLGSGAAGRELAARADVVFGHGDPNLANFLWDGREMRVVDFEDSGPSDRAFELAILVEHLSAWSDARLEAGPLLELFELSAAERARLLQFRRLAALFWLMMLRPGGPASRRNPPGTLCRQADRLLALLG